MTRRTFAGDLGSNTAYVGFTSATGSGWENHDLLDWQLASDIGLAMPPSPPTTGVPEPMPLGLGGIGIIAMLVARRRASIDRRR